MQAHHHAFPFLIFLLVGLGIYVAVQRRRHPERYARSGAPLEGFAGWLIFIGVLQGMAVLQVAGELMLHFREYQLQAPTIANPYARAGRIGGLVFQILLVALVLWSAVMMLRKSRTFPRLFRIELVLLVLIPVLLALLLKWVADHSALSPQLQLFYWVRAGIMAPAAAAAFVYSLRSERFRNTFVK
jgi:hypothetical protein